MWIPSTLNIVRITSWLVYLVWLILFMAIRCGIRVAHPVWLAQLTMWSPQLSHVETLIFRSCLYKLEVSSQQGKSGPILAFPPVLACSLTRPGYLPTRVPVAICPLRSALMWIAITNETALSNLGTLSLKSYPLALPELVILLTRVLSLPNGFCLVNSTQQMLELSKRASVNPWIYRLT